MEVGSSHASRLGAKPQLEILWAVVEAVTVDVVDVLARDKRSAEFRLHDNSGEQNR